MTNAVEIQAVRKTFGRKVAVDGLDLIVPAGSLCGFIGPNGAGKTTTIRMIMSILFPDEGRISVLGRASAVESKDRIGYLPEERGVYRKMRVGAFLKYAAKLKGADDGGGLTNRVRGWLERLDLAGCEKKRCEELSKGMQQKVQFIATVIHEPELLILDEPFSGLDPVNMRLLRTLIHEQHEAGKTVIFSTHVMQQAEELCDHIFMIHDGKKVLDSTMPRIRAQYDPRTVVIESREAGGEREMEHEAWSLPGVRDVSLLNGVLELSLEDGVDPQATMRAATERLAVRRVEIRRPTLEDVFIGIVQGKGRAGAQEVETLRAALRDEPVGQAVSEGAA